MQNLRFVFVVILSTLSDSGFLVKTGIRSIEEFSQGQGKGSGPSLNIKFMK